MSVERRVTKSGVVRYDVRLRTPEGRAYKRTFKTKREAERFEASELVDRARGTWIDPELGRITFADWSAEWYESAQHRWRTRTAEKHEMALRVHWSPRLGGYLLASLTPRHVQAVVNELAGSHEAASVRTYYGTLRACLRAAADMDLIGRTPCRGIMLPKPGQRERRLVAPDELHRLADAVGPQRRCLIYLGGVAGLRFGEAVALRVRDIDLRAGSVSCQGRWSSTTARWSMVSPRQVLDTAPWPCRWSWSTSCSCTWSCLASAAKISCSLMRSADRCGGATSASGCLTRLCELSTSTA